jgi:hypothetical protein
MDTSPGRTRARFTGAEEQTKLCTQMVDGKDKRGIKEKSSVIAVKNQDI